jgi:hypothetical protein
VEEGGPDFGRGLPMPDLHELSLGPGYSAQGLEEQEYSAEQVASLEIELSNWHDRIAESEVVFKYQLNCPAFLLMTAGSC